MRTLPVVGLTVVLCLGGWITTDETRSPSENGLSEMHVKESTGTPRIFTIRMNFSEPLVITEGAYAGIEMQGTNSVLAEGGMPQLPYYATTLTLPWGTKITDITCTTGKMKSTMLDHAIARAPMPRDVNTGKMLPFRERTDAQAPYPGEWYRYRTGSGLSNGTHVMFLSLHLYPVRYEETAHRIIHVSSLEVRVSCETPEDPLLAADTYDLLVIAPSEFGDALQPLVTHKESHGVRTMLVTDDEIYSGDYFDVQGRDDAEKIKYFIKEALENWGIRYVLLVGDITHVPSREVLRFAWGDHAMYSDHY